MYRSLKQIAEKVSSIGKVPKNDVKSLMAPVDSLESNITPGDILSFRYKRSYKNGTVLDGYYICLSARVAGKGSSFTISTLGNQLYGGFELDQALPETILTIVNSIYKNRQKSKTEMSPEIAKKMLASVLGLKQYKTFDTKYISNKFKVSFEEISRQSSELISSEEGM